MPYDRPTTEKRDFSSQSNTEILEALKLFDLTPPLTQEQLNQRYKHLLLVWLPHRYAGLTNNPTKYMKMYKKGEDMTREVHAAYRLLTEWINLDQIQAEDAGTP